VTLRIKAGLPTLRTRAVLSVLHRVFAAARERFGFRLVHFSVQGNHVHLIVEGDDRRAVSRGMKGLAIRMAKALNKLWGRAGSVFDDHYHEVPLASPRQVRNALAYVLHNAKKHGARLRGLVDSFTSAAWFDGWKESIRLVGSMVQAPVTRARSWILQEGWRRRGLISIREAPAPAT
jgi:REP element-mobilizing transposase RayT